MKEKLIFKLIGAIIVCTFIAYLSITNCNIAKEPVNKYLGKEISFSEAKEEIVNGYTENIKQKYAFVNLNGLFTKMFGGRVCNDVLKLNNGMLTPVEVEGYDMSNNANTIVQINNHLNDKGIDFFYVQSPSKIDMNNEVIPIGVTNEINNNTNELLSQIEKEGVNVLDLRENMVDTVDKINQYFYVTDHHWNPIGAFKAFQEISEYLQMFYPNEPIMGEYQTLNNWEVHRKESWFLGSQGKRTGTYFGGVDDLIWLTPKFDTSMSFLNVYKDEYYNGDYSDANIRDIYINECDYFGLNAYCVYVGGDYPLVQHRNNNAPVEKKVLIVKDSFVLPLQTYFSTVFKEVDVIDMRHYTAGTLDEFIMDSKPDIVIMNFNASAVTKDELFGGEVNALDISDYDKSMLILNNENADILPNYSDDYNYISLYDGLKAGSKYVLECNSIDVLDGCTEAVSIKLYNKDYTEFYDCCMWDLNYCKNNGRYEWTFTTPYDVDNLKLVIYSGVPGATKGNGLRLSGIRLFEYYND